MGRIDRLAALPAIRQYMARSLLHKILKNAQFITLIMHNRHGCPGQFSPNRMTVLQNIDDVFEIGACPAIAATAAMESGKFSCQKMGGIEDPDIGRLIYPVCDGMGKARWVPWVAETQYITTRWHEIDGDGPYGIATQDAGPDIAHKALLPQRVLQIGEIAVGCQLNDQVHILSEPGISRRPVKAYPGRYHTKPKIRNGLWPTH